MEASLSSTYTGNNGIVYKAEYCIDGRDDGWDVQKFKTDEPVDLCHGGTKGTAGEKAPWFAIDYGENNLVSVGKVVIANRAQCCGNRFKKAEVRLSAELPGDGETMFEGGVLLAKYEGPSSDGEKIEIESEDGSEGSVGRYLIIQLDKTDKAGWLNIKEVTAFGRQFEVVG